MEPLPSAAAAHPRSNGVQEPSKSPSTQSDTIHCIWGTDRKRYVFTRSHFDAACSFLCHVWGIDDLKTQQKQTLEALFRGQDTIALLPTGFGKTLSFQGLVLLFDYLFNGAPDAKDRKHPSNPTFIRPVLIVVSPLTQLILRQVADFNDKMKHARCSWLSAACAYTLDGNVADSHSELGRRIHAGRANIVYLSPGHLIENGRYRSILDSAAYAGRIVAFIVDEVHCVHHWGVDFRPEYSRLSSCRAVMGYSVPCGGFTATLTPEDQHTTCLSLAMNDVCVVQASPDRANIFLRCEPFDHLVDEPDLFDPLIRELRALRQATPKLLIYVKDKTRAERYWSYLLDEVRDACRVSGGVLLVDLVSGDLNPEQVKFALVNFLDTTSPTRVLFSSEVLGMGVDIKGLARVWVIGQFATLKEYDLFS